MTGKRHAARDRHRRFPWRAVRGRMLMRSGWDVTIFERSEGRLEGRGAGLGVHPPMLQGLLAAGAEVDGERRRRHRRPHGLCPRWEHRRRASRCRSFAPPGRGSIRCCRPPFPRNASAAAPRSPASSKIVNGVTARLADGSEVRGRCAHRRGRRPLDRAAADAARRRSRLRRLHRLARHGRGSGAHAVHPCRASSTASHGASSIASTSSATRCRAPLDDLDSRTAPLQLRLVPPRSTERRLARCRPMLRAASMPKESRPS